MRPLENWGKIERHGKGFPPSTVPNQIEPEEGVRTMADESQYTDSTYFGNVERYENVGAP
ncbi:MAG: hypothetical protein EBT13_15725 [Rhodobacteraceae bacterium]|nr:hypothetical protein [Paracoccaceae bacterium]